MSARETPSIIDEVSHRSPWNLCEILQFTDIDKGLFQQPIPDVMLFVIKSFHTVYFKIELFQMYAFEYIYQNGKLE